MHVFFFDCDLNAENIRNEFKTMVRSYFHRAQDKKAGRDFTEKDYITDERSRSACTKNVGFAHAVVKG
jgi:hypothetical protein